MEEVIKVEDCGENIGDYDIPIHNAIIIPRGATNGDVIKKMISNAEIDTDPYRPSVDIRIDGFMMMRVDRNWWKAPYKGEEA
jgi:hypothetical protein